jgi:hypothetical protein
MMPCYFPACSPRTLVSAQARRLSSHASSTNRAQAAACPCILSCCFACEPRGRERLRATEKSAIMRWSQTCRRAASMHVGIVLTVWPYVRDACFLFVASTYTRYCPGLFLVRLCDCVIHPPSPLFSSSLTLSLSEFPLLTHSLPLCKFMHFNILCLPPSPVFLFLFFLRRSRLLIPSYLLNAHLLFPISFMLPRYIWI